MTNYLVGADWKIPNWLIWLIKSTFLGKSEATISLGIKSVLFSWTWTPIPVIFLFNTVTTQQILDKACHAPLGMQVSGVLASLLLCGDTWVACGGVCICRVKSCHASMLTSPGCSTAFHTSYHLILTSWAQFLCYQSHPATLLSRVRHFIPASSELWSVTL